MTEIILRCKNTKSIPIEFGFEQQGNKLVGTDRVGFSTQQGYSVSLSADGNTLAVGGYSDDNFLGATWIFTRIGKVWTQEAKLVGTGNIGNSWQGYSVSLSADGNTLAVGGRNDDTGIGATWIFTRIGNLWTQEAKLVGTGNIGSSGQGSSVSLSADGNTLAVGASEDAALPLVIGATWIFTRIGSVWTQEAKLVGTGYIVPSRQGYSVSLSADGNTLAVGAESDTSGIGATWIFTRIGSVWTQEAKLVGTGNIGSSRQGSSVSLSANGDILAVGAQSDNSGIGATWIFTRIGSVWTQQVKLVGTGNVGVSGQGSSVSLSKDGKTLAIGAQFNQSSIGATWIFYYSNNTWVQKQRLVGNGYSGISGQGSSVSLNTDGKTLAVGGWRDNQYIGASWIFQIPIAPPLRLCQYTPTRKLCSYVKNNIA